MEPQPKRGEEWSVLTRKDNNKAARIKPSRTQIWRGGEKDTTFPPTWGGKNSAHRAFPRLGRKREVLPFDVMIRRCKKKTRPMPLVGFEERHFSILFKKRGEKKEPVSLWVKEKSVPNWLMGKEERGTGALSRGGRGSRKEQFSSRNETPIGGTEA